jgi:hypothetical protein
LQDTAVKLKLLLEKVTGVPVASQKLTCCGKILKDSVSLYVDSCDADCVGACKPNTLCMLESGVKSGVLIQLFVRAASATPVTSPSSQSIGALRTQVFDSAVKGDHLAVVAALQVILDCMRICLPVNGESDGSSSHQ